MDSRDPLDECREYLLDVADQIQRQVAELKLALATLRQEGIDGPSFTAPPAEYSGHLDPTFRVEAAHS